MPSQTEHAAPDISRSEAAGSWSTGLNQNQVRPTRHPSPTSDETLSQPRQIHHLWAKQDRHAGCYHPLIYHLLDVAAVAVCIWDVALSPAQKTHLKALLDSDEASTQQQLALLAGLHDIGKATPAFQHLHDTRHGSQSAAIVTSWLEGKGFDRQRASPLASAIGGHHGHWISAHDTGKAHTGDESWPKLQEAICDRLETVLGVSAIALPSAFEDLNVFAVFVSGLVSVCDWIGSHTDYFPYEEREIDLEAYYARALAQAHRALAALGWLSWSPDRSQPAFESLFPFPPNALQRAGIKVLQALQEKPVVFLIESQTGSGKTELGQYMTDWLVNLFRLYGFYIAMPTQATSNQMHRRVNEFHERRYPAADINVRLIHAQAEHVLSLQATRPCDQQAGNKSALDAADWFGNRKRALLAPNGVGTIDQALLSVVGAKHHFVRLFGLSQKVVIFDEVHSYDVYMSVMIERLIQWLPALGSPVILLSATLSRSARAKLLAAAGASCEANLEARYPRMTVVEQDGSVKAHELPSPDPRSIRIRHIPCDIDSLQRELLLPYRQGGCIAVVCNTVDESIQVAQALHRTEGIDADDVWLLHARFPSIWRGEREDKVLRAFVKDGQRPARAILVASQIIEQSLDLDFDLMISRTAPIDSLIQRVGRLHRHLGRARPSHLAEPTLIWRLPEMNSDGAPDFGADEAIYARYILLKTWLLLRPMTTLRTPTDVDELVNLVYDQNCDIADQGAVLETALQELQLDDEKSEADSRNHVIGSPADELLLSNPGARWPDDDTRQALTRDIPPGIDVVCLIDEPLMQMAERVPSRDETAILLRYKLTIRSQSIRQALAQLPIHKAWARQPQLKYARPLVFDNGCCRLPDSPYMLRLTRDYGLEIIKTEAECALHST